MANKITSKLIYTIFLSGLITACGTYDTQYRDKEDAQPTINNPDSYTSFYSLGNAGTSNDDIDSKYVEALQEHFRENATENDFLFFLGDNIHDSDLEKYKPQFNQQVTIAKSFSGKSFFIPGEREWNDGSIKKLEDIEDLVEQKLDREAYQPENGCPLEIIEDDKDFSIFILDSQWFIEDWSKIAHFNDACTIKTREQLLYILKDEMRKARHKNVLLVMHHPMYTNGVYGGEIPLDVLYRPSKNNLYIPLAGFGYAFLRSQGGISKQDQFNPLMNRLMQELETIALQVPRLFVLSAHENNLQYITHNNLRQIISGSLSKKEAVRLGKDGEFVSTRNGFSELRLYQDGSSQILFYELDANTNTFKTAFSKVAFTPPKAYPIDSLSNNFASHKEASVYPQKEVKKDDAFIKRWGKHYRTTYGIKVKAPVAILDTLYGGLHVERAGGGNQTQSLRLVDKDDKEYNMRALAKDPYAFLKSSGYDDLDAQRYFSATIPQELIKDFYTAAHPYGAFAIPRLAGAVNLNHTHPKLYYIPKHKALGNFNKTHGNRLYMIVEKPDDDFNSGHMFGFNEDVESTSDLFEKIREDEKNRIDEEAYIRARIFDMLVGDWDRHEDQWRWAQKQLDDKDAHEFIAIPRDRDQVFANFDGKFLQTLQKFVGATRQFGKYGPDIKFIKQFSQSAINLDRALIQRSELKTWIKQAKYIQNHITPKVVEKAFKEMPIEVQDDTWSSIQEDLLSRKQNLVDIVERYYKHFIDFQTLKGTDKDDRFYIKKLENGDLNIKAYRIKDGEDGTLLFDRLLKQEQTSEVWIYGLDDDDEFIVTPKGKSTIKTVIAGGLGEDIYEIHNGQNITVYDQEQADNTIVKRGGARFRINNTYENHIYDSERKPHRSKVFALNTFYNPDLGIVPELTLGQEKYGFEGFPFTSKIELQARYYSLTQAGDASLSLHFAHLFPDWNLKISGRGTTHNYTENFFGFGNETTAFKNYDANRVFMQRFESAVSTYYNGEYGTSFSFGLRYESIAPENSNQVAFTPTNLNAHYLKTEASYSYLSVDEKAYPTRGMHATASGFYADNLTNTQTITAIDPTITFWNAIDTSRDLVIKTQLQGQLRFGNTIPFYQAAHLGSERGLRSFRMRRFTGKQALAASADLSYKFSPIKTILFPLRTYAFIGYDIGRVWIENETSKKLYSSYGGGLQMAMGGFLKGKIGYFTGEEGGRLSFGITFGN